MAKNPIDKLFRDKLAERRFVYEDSFWTKAAKGLDQPSESKGMKPFWLFLRSFVVTALIVSAVWLLNFNFKTDSLSNDSKDQASITKSDEGIAGIAEAISKDPGNPATEKWALNKALPKQEEQLGSNAKKSDKSRNVYDHDAATPDRYAETNSDPALKDHGPGDMYPLQPDESGMDSEGKLSVAGDRSIPLPPTEPEDTSIDVPEVEAGAEAMTGQPGQSNEELNRSPFFSKSISGFGGVMYHSLNVENVNAVFLSETDRILKGTKNQVSPEIGIRAGLHYRSWDITAGAIAASYKGETRHRFYTNYTSIDSSIVNLRDSFILRVDPNSGRIDTIWFFKDSSYLRHDTTVMRRTDQDQESYNGIIRYRYLEIPVMIGHAFPLGKKTSVFVHGGVSMGILRSVSGYQLNPFTGRMEAISSENFSKLFWFATAYGGVAYEFIPSMSLYGELGGKWNITDLMMAPTHTERLQGYGMRIGIEYRF